MLKISAKLLPSGQHEIFMNEKSIGKVWKFKNSHTFGLILNGIFYDTTGKIATGGSPIKSFKRMRDAMEYVKDILVSLRTV